MLSEENPCKNCTFDTGRYIGCHTNCEKHRKWKEKFDGIKEKRKQEALATPDLPRAMKKHIWRTMKDKQ